MTVETFWGTADPVAPPAEKPASSSGSIFGDPVSSKTLSSLVTGEAPPVGYGEDIRRSAPGALVRGVTGGLGTLGTVGEYARWGAEKVLPKGAVDIAAGAVKYGGGPLGALLTGPSGADLQKKVEDQTGKFYEAQTVPGQFTSTALEMAPGALAPGGIVRNAATGAVNVARTLAPRVANWLMGAAGSETAGQLTKGTAYEPYARFAGGITGPALGAKLITPSGPTTPALQRAVATMDAEGIPVRAGVRTGNKALQWIEDVAGDMPFSGATAANQRQADAFNRAMTDRMFDRGQLTARGVPAAENLPSREVFREGKNSLSDMYRRLTGNNQLQSDPQTFRDLQAALNNYEYIVAPTGRNPAVSHWMNDVIDRFIAGQGKMPGDVYQAQRSKFDKLSKGQRGPGGDTELAEVYKRMRNALDQTMERSLPVAESALWRQNNTRWGNMRQVEKAVAAAGENLTPMGVAQAVRSGRSAQAAAGTGSMDDLAHAAQITMKPLPQSGTQPRQMVMSGFGGGTLATAAAMMGLGPIGAAGAFALPFAAARGVVSPWGQRYLGNRAMPQNTRDVITQALMQQAASQPGAVDRNERGRVSARQKFDEDLRRSGFR